MYLGKLKTKEDVFCDKRNLNNTPKDLLLKALLKIEAKGDIFFEEIQFDAPIGLSNCVLSEEDVNILYGRRKGRNGFTRFVINRPPEPSDVITVILKRVKDHYTVLTSYIGTWSPAEPWDTRATKESEEFWKTHALVLTPEMKKDVISWMEF